ncbi:hypothetical protein [Rubinisphaera italica]|nr:hypothetical protein [Rubinisphaera italica]
MKNSSSQFAVAAMFVVSFLVGCGASDGPDLISTDGEVKWQNEPLKEGRITFRMLEAGGNVFSAPIEEGYFKIESLPGKMKVEIIASRLIPGKFDESNGTPEPVGEMYIPAQYNSRSELTYVVERGADSPVFELSIDEKKI